jgi:hypothetical protein
MRAECMGGRKGDACISARWKGDEPGPEAWLSTVNSLLWVPLTSHLLTNLTFVKESINYGLPRLIHKARIRWTSVFFLVCSP